MQGSLLKAGKQFPIIILEFLTRLTNLATSMSVRRVVAAAKNSKSVRTHATTSGIQDARRGTKIRRSKPIERCRDAIRVPERR